MGLSLRRGLVVVVCLVAILGGQAWAQLPIKTNPADGCAAPGFDDRCEFWTTTYHDAEAAPDSSQSPAGVAESRDGRTVYGFYMTTTGVGFDSRSTCAAVAYDAATGERNWVSKWGDPGRYNLPSGIVAGRNLVYVTGSSRDTFSDVNGVITTLALDPATGEIVWETTYNHSPGTDNARTLALSPDGRTLYIAGISSGQRNEDLDYALIAYDAQTGAERFVTRYDGIGINGSDSPFGMAVAPSGDMVFLTGWSAGLGEFNVDYGTIAVRTAGPDLGSIAWEARYDGSASRAPDQANAIAVDPNGSKVYVTGLSSNVTEGPPFSVDYSYGTVAYDARTGEFLWDARTKWEGTNFNSATALAADAAGRVFVTGQSRMATGGDNNVGTVALDAATGEQLWHERYGVPEHNLELGRAIAVSPRSDGVYVTGVSSSSRTSNVYLGQAQNGDQLTLGYDPATGERLFTARYNATGYDYDSGRDALVSRDGATLFLTTALTHNVEMDRNFYDAGLITYEIGPSTPPPPDRQPTSVRFTERSMDTATYSDEVTLEVALSDEQGAPLEGRDVDITIGDRTLRASTDADGIATVTTDVTEAPGEHPVSATFAGDDSYEGSTATASLSVTQEATVLSLSASGHGANKLLTARLADEDDPSGIAGRTIVFFNENEEIGRATTDQTGTASLEVPPGGRGAKETFTASFAGDAYYLGSQAASTPTKPWV